MTRHERRNLMRTMAHRSIINNETATLLTGRRGRRHIAGMIGPNGEKRPNDVIANAVLAARIATGEVEEEYVDPSRQDRGRLGACRTADAGAPARDCQQGGTDTLV